jgi:serine/threonine protein kinase
MGPQAPEQDAQPGEHISSLINEFFDRRKAGEDLTRERFIAEHAEAADELRRHLADLSLYEKACAPESGALAAAGSDATAKLPPIEGYELIEEIGRGGMGVVYRALQLSTKRVVALKVMLAGPFASPAGRRRFQREVELAARLQHASIVRILESGEAAGQRYYAMDYVAGTRLDRYLSAAQPDVRTTLCLFVQICEAVQYAHGHGVIHRDLKPGNVLIDDEGNPHVLDFGLAKATDEAGTEATVTAYVSLPGEVVGTLFYLSPEQAAGTPDELDVRTDVYALGVMLFEALTGSLPFDMTGRPSDVIGRILEDTPTRPRTLSNRIDDDLETIILKALEKEKARRYQSAKELAEDLQRYLAGDPILAKRPSRLYVLRKKLRKHRWPAAAASASVALAAVLLVVSAWWQRRELFQAQLVAVELLRRMEETGKADLAGATALCERYWALRDAQLVRAQALYRDKDERWPQSAQNAASHLERIIGPNPSKSSWPYVALQAELYRAAGDEERAARLAAAAERAAPDTAEAWHLRSLATLEIPKALRCAQEAVARDPTHRLAWRRLIYLRVQTGDLEGGLQGVDRLIALGEKSANWLAFKGHVLLRHGRVREAIEQYTRAEMYHYRAHAYRRLREYDLAVADYTRVIEAYRRDRIESVAAWYIYHRATPLWILGRPEEALRDYRDVRRLLGRPSYGDARAFLILREQGRLAEANELLAAALRDVTEAWLRQILRCLAGELTPEALVGDAEARGNLEQLCEACYYAGEVCLLNGQQAAAREWFERCVATALTSDLDAGEEAPMNEYELAEWRLASRFPETAPASNP